MGSGGSKAAQRTASRAAAAAATHPPGSAAAAAEPAIESAVRTAERQREASLLARQAQLAAEGGLPAERREDNAGVVSSMNKLMPRMQQHQVKVYQNPEVDAQYSLKRKTKAEREADLVGRLASPSLKSLLEEHATLSQQGRRPDAAELARVYGADPEVLQAVLRHNSVPVVHATQEGRLHGAWPRGTAPAR